MAIAKPRREKGTANRNAKAVKVAKTKIVKEKVKKLKFAAAKGKTILVIDPQMPASGLSLTETVEAAGVVSITETIETTGAIKATETIETTGTVEATGTIEATQTTTTTETVSAPQNTKPLAHVHLRLKTKKGDSLKNSKAAQSNEEGEFVFKNIKPGEYILKVWAKNAYCETTEAVVKVDAGATVDIGALRFHLRPKVVENLEQQL